MFAGRPLATDSLNGFGVAVYARGAFVDLCAGSGSATLTTNPLRRSEIGRHAILPLATVTMDGSVYWTLVETKRSLDAVKIQTLAGGLDLASAKRVAPGLFLGSFTGKSIEPTRTGGHVREAVAVAYQSSRAVATARIAWCWHLGFILFNRVC
jgi:hypothetical protein